MSNHNPTNGELAIMIASLRELMEQRFKENTDCHERVDKHLTRLNGQVAKNTKITTIIKSYGSLVVFLVPLMISLIVKYL